MENWAGRDMISGGGRKVVVLWEGVRGWEVTGRGCKLFFKEYPNKTDYLVGPTVETKNDSKNDIFFLI